MLDKKLLAMLLTLVGISIIIASSTIPRGIQVIIVITLGAIVGRMSK